MPTLTEREWEWERKKGRATDRRVVRLEKRQPVLDCQLVAAVCRIVDLEQTVVDLRAEAGRQAALIRKLGVISATTREELAALAAREK